MRNKLALGLFTFLLSFYVGASDGFHDLGGFFTPENARQYQDLPTMLAAIKKFEQQQYRRLYINRFNKFEVTSLVFKDRSKISLNKDFIEWVRIALHIHEVPNAVTRNKGELKFLINAIPTLVNSMSQKNDEQKLENIISLIKVFKGKNISEYLLRSVLALAKDYNIRNYINISIPEAAEVIISLIGQNNPQGLIDLLISGSFRFNVKSSQALNKFFENTDNQELLLEALPRSTYYQAVYQNLNKRARHIYTSQLFSEALKSNEFFLEDQAYYTEQTILAFGWTLNRYQNLKDISEITEDFFSLVLGKDEGRDLTMNRQMLDGFIDSIIELDMQELLLELEKYSEDITDESLNKIMLYAKNKSIYEEVLALPLLGERITQLGCLKGFRAL